MIAKKLLLISSLFLLSMSVISFEGLNQTLESYSGTYKIKPRIKGFCKSKVTADVKANGSMVLTESCINRWPDTEVLYFQCDGEEAVCVIDQSRNPRACKGAKVEFLSADKFVLKNTCSKGPRDIYFKKEADALALEKCNKYFAGKDLKRCLKIVKGGRFEKDALNLCDRQGRSKSYRVCLKTVKGGTFQELALEVCESYSSTSRINSCLKIIKDGRFQESALEICDSNYREKRVSSCLKAIKNKMFTAEELKSACIKQRWRSSSRCL